LHQLPHHGFGGRGRHIASFDRTMALAVGYTYDASHVQHAAVWPEITNTGGGTLNDLPTPDPTRPSTGASYSELADGSYLLVGQWTESSGMRRAAIWRNTPSMLWSYTGMALPQAPGSTGSEAHDVVAFPNGGAAVVGHDWPTINGVIQWIASVWRISPTGEIQETFLPKPLGTGWSKALSVGQDVSQPGLLTVVGSIQETPGGPWRACMWRYNAMTDEAAFRYMGNASMEDWAYRTSLNGMYSVGWREDGEGNEYPTFWEMRQGFPQTTLNLEGRLYGINDRGYFVGTQVDGLLMRDGLVGNIQTGNNTFPFSSLVKDFGGLQLADHLYCAAADGQLTGCTTSGASYLPFAAVPTGDHGPDASDVIRGQITGESGATVNLMQPDGNTLDVRAQQGRVVLDTSILSAPLGFDEASISITLDTTGPGTTEGKLIVFDTSTQRYVPTGLSFSWGANQTASGSWATFPSSWRSSSGEVRFRLILEPQGRRDIVSIDAITFKTN
jgi:hypothetical protein